MSADEVDPTHILLTHAHVDHLADAVGGRQAHRRPSAWRSSRPRTGLGGQGVENVSDPNLGGTVEFDWGWVKLVQAFHSSTTPDGTVTYARAAWSSTSPGRPSTTSATPACSATCS